MQFNAGSLAAAALFFGSTYGHLIMTSPVPFGKDSLNNSPLVDAAIGSSSSDFPCKQRAGVYDITSMNHMKVGEEQTLDFEGSASHGGGTCQLVISLDKEPDTNSTFKIIQTFMGGCPTSADGNSGTHPFSFKIPKEVPNGESTFAWVWYNKIGNREIYMNCAPITVTGGSDNTDAFNKLPNMYLINLPSSNGCRSADTADVEIPHPGQYVAKGPSSNLKAAEGPMCAAAAAAQLAGGSVDGGAPSDDGGYGAPPNNGGSGYGGPPSGGAPSASAPIASPTAPGGGAGAGKDSPPTYPTANATSGGSGAYSPAATGAPAGTGSSAPSYGSGSSGSGSDTSGSSGDSGSSSSGSSSSTGGSCSGDSILCDDSGDKFGLCDNGTVVWQAVAPGTKCEGGAIQKRNTRRNGGVHLRRHVQNVGKHVMV